jgi:predicted N-formylglutamate amidohydrolase
LSERLRYVLSCEHAGNRVPERYRGLFETVAAKGALFSHRGWDPGALEVAEVLADRLGAPLVAQTVTRLLVECNRSEDHPALWSEYSRGFPAAERTRILDEIWRSHRQAVRERVEVASVDGTVVHLGIHSFTPVWRGRARSTDIGILHDPARGTERAFAVSWRRRLAAALRPLGLVTHLNRPYRGWTDGLTTTLRRAFAQERYLGLEVEISQRLMPLRGEILDALEETLPDL